MNTQWETRFSCLISAAGAVWLSYVATHQFRSFATLLLPPGPLKSALLGF
jgi:hypothetical protein